MVGKKPAEAKGLQGLQREKVMTLVKRYRTARSTAREAVSKIGGEAKAKYDDIVDEANRKLGIEPAAFKKLMKADDLSDKLMGVRSGIEDDTILDHFDKLCSVVPEIGDLFDAADQREAASGKKPPNGKPADAKPGDSKPADGLGASATVTSIADRSGASLKTTPAAGTG